MDSYEKKFKEVSVPEGLSAAAGDLEGEVNLMWEPVYSANSYIIQICKSLQKPENWIQQDIVTKSNHTVSRLKSKSNYWFRIAAVNSTGQSSWSKPVSKKVP